MGSGFSEKLKTVPVYGTQKYEIWVCVRYWSLEKPVIRKAHNLGVVKHQQYFQSSNCLLICLFTQLFISYSIVQNGSSGIESTTF